MKTVLLHIIPFNYRRSCKSLTLVSRDQEKLKNINIVLFILCHGQELLLNQFSILYNISPNALEILSKMNQVQATYFEKGVLHGASHKTIISTWVLIVIKFNTS